MRRFREQNGSNPRFLSFSPKWKPSCSRKLRSRHLPLAMTLFAKVGSTKEELGVDEEAGASSLDLVHFSHSNSLEGHSEEAFLGGICGLGGILARVLSSEELR